MKKKVLAGVLSLLLCLPLGGCWDYRGLNTLDITTGVAIDWLEETQEYLLTFEIINTRFSGEQLKTSYVQSRGGSIIETVRNAKKRLANQLYGGNLRTLIVSESLARTQGLDSVSQYLLRDGEPRETICMMISQEKTAAEILLAKGLDNPIAAYAIQEMVVEDNGVTGSTRNLPLYRIFENSRTPGKSLVLPAVHLTENDGEGVPEANGIAIFRGDRLVGYDSPEDTFMFLVLKNEVKGGILTVPIAEESLEKIQEETQTVQGHEVSGNHQEWDIDPDKERDTRTPPEGTDHFFSAKVKKNRTKVKVSLEEGQVCVTVDLTMNLHVAELPSPFRLSELSHRRELERLSVQHLNQSLTEYFHDSLSKYGLDIFGYGAKIYQRDPELWRSVEEQWDRLFQEAVFSVDTRVEILTSGVLKDY